MLLYFSALVVYVTLVSVNTYVIDDNQLISPHATNMQDSETHKVKVQLFYECYCPHCVVFDTQIFKQAVEKLGAFMDIHLYPYGNAKTILKDGSYQFKCQHGPRECYGDTLHACAIDSIGNITKAVSFNACMMDPARKNNGSDDEAADTCGKSMNIDSEKIKECARGPKGIELLKYNGEESKKAGFKHVPYILINGQKTNASSFMNDLCGSFSNPPTPCLNIMKE